MIRQKNFARYVLNYVIPAEPNAESIKHRIVRNAPGYVNPVRKNAVKWPPKIINPGAG
ncbi:hypothetical protein N824_12525 [Pedobacter sp. V48]|nr:hypothetical protein N824_12525 [Pedobacter sp. V48]